MLSRTLPSLSRSISTAVAGSSRSRSSHGLPIAHRVRLQVPIVQALRSGRTYSTPAAPAAMDEGEKAIYEKLSAKFPGNRLEVQDVSGGCGSFYAILISSPAFKGLSTIKQHKLVNSCLKEDIKTIHGLQLKTIPEE